MYISLYRKYRPQTFSEMVGQNAAVSLLQESLRENKLGHAYLFSGQRGCGKTSAARLVAKTLNCTNLTKENESCGVCSNCISITMGEHLDVIEIDGASNRGINEIRDLKTHVNLKPLSAPKKIYIIDEVHMLTEAAFNALLKTLEEPPTNVYFLLATTEPYKVPVTIRSRCQHIPFHRISVLDMVERIAFVCESEKVQYDKEAIWEIARQADGALRDALSLSEQAIAFGKGVLSIDSVNVLTAGSSRSEIENWIVTLRLDPGNATVKLNKMLSKGMSPESFCESLFSLFRDLWVFRLWGESALAALDISTSGQKFLKEESPQWSPEKLRAVCMFCNSLLPRTRYGIRMEVFSGLIMLKLTEIANDTATIRVDKEKRKIDENATVSLEKETIIHTKTPQPLRLDSEAVQKEDKADMSVNTISTSFQNDMSKGLKSKLDIAKICAELGDNPLSMFLSKFKANELLIAAALIDGLIILNENEDDWKLTYPNDSLSKSIMSVSKNKAIISKAVEAIIGKKITKNNQKKAITSSTTKMGIKKAKDTENSNISRVSSAVEDKGEFNVGASPDRLLKLLGAEILYVQDSSVEDEIGLSNCDGEQNE